MTRRRRILAGIAAGVVWTVGVLWLGASLDLPVMALIPTVMVAFLAPGLILMALIGRIAQRRFFDDEIIDGGPLTGAAEIDRRVLVNTVEQIALALCLWPAAAVALGANGPGVVAVLGLAFGAARVLFWVGYHLSPPLRAFGFAATFYPTVAAAVWTLLELTLI